jgi:hypothetical protein
MSGTTILAQLGDQHIATGKPIATWLGVGPLAHGSAIDLRPSG